MKQIITLALSLTFTINYAQTMTIFDKVLNTSGLAIDGNNLYIGALFDNKIYQLDWTESNPTATILVDNLDKPNGLAIHGNYLYASLNSNLLSNDKIVRIDISQSNPVVEEFVKIGNPNGIVFREDEMYVSADESIYYIDVNASNPVPQEIIVGEGFSGFGIIGLCMVDNYLVEP